MDYELGKMKYVILETCPHCHGTGLEPDYPTNGGGQPPSGTQTCHICNGDLKVVKGEIWSID